MTDLGKDAEHQIKLWLNKPDQGYAFNRLYDQMTGFYQVSRNICDFICYKFPNEYYIESKATYSDRFDFSMISDTQYHGLLEKSSIRGCFGYIIVLFAEYKKAFILDIRDIDWMISKNKKSLNIKKLDNWLIPSIQIPTIPSRKNLLDYDGHLDELSNKLQDLRNSDTFYNL